MAGFQAKTLTDIDHRVYPFFPDSLGFHRENSSRVEKSGSGIRLLHINPCGTFANFFETEERAISGPRANAADSLPRLGAFQVRIPERPRSALDGSGLIDFAVPFDGVKEGAVPVFVFRQRNPAADNASMEQANFPDRFVEISGNFLNFFVRDPDNSRWPGTAVATLSAGELEAVFVPGFR